MRLLQRQVDTLANCERAAVLDRGRLGQVLRASAADVKAVLSRHSQEARKALQLFLRDRLCFTPMERDGRRGYRFQGEGTYNGLLSGEAFPPTMVAPYLKALRRSIGSRAPMPVPIESPILSVSLCRLQGTRSQRGPYLRPRVSVTFRLVLTSRASR